MVNKLIEKFKNIWKTEGQEPISTPKNVNVTFVLKLNGLTIGSLTLNDGNWTFKYSDAFKQQNKLKPLANFPNKDKVYSSPELYPFFQVRIPSLKQPKIQEIIEKEALKQDSVSLLERFGEFTISNPYQLKPEYSPTA